MARARTLGVSGSAVLMAAGGIYLAYVGIQDVPIVDGVRDLLRGKRPTEKRGEPYGGPERSSSGGGTPVNAPAGNLPGGPVDKGSTVVIPGTQIRVHKSIKQQITNLVFFARLALPGRRIDGYGWRSNAEQRSLRLKHCCRDPNSSRCGCGPPTAPPGVSRHERGLAIDFTLDGHTIRNGDPLHNWLRANARTYGLSQLPSEPWHWSTDGH